MLRSTRGLLLLAIVLMLGAVAATYYRQKITQAGQSPPTPKTLPPGTDAAATSWVWRKDQATHGIVEVRAKRFRQLNAPSSAVEIEEVEVLIYKQEGREYDHIRCAKATFDQSKGTLYSDGDVNITMGVPAGDVPHGRLLQIRSSGVTYDIKSGKVSTDRAASFEFAQGEGRSVGATYDPNIREIYMKSQVELYWRGRSPKAKVMKIEAGELTYKERDSYVLLRPWSRLTRETGVLEGGDTVVSLKDGAIEKVEGKQARGTDHQPGRDLEYSAAYFVMRMDDDGVVERISGEPDAHLVSTTQTARTNITSRRVDMIFDTASGASELKNALATGNAVIESAPVARKDVPPAETRVVHSERVLLTMRNGGRELATVETQAPGRLEFLPNREGQRRRTLDADRMTVTYGANNAIQSFVASNAATRTDPDPKNAKKSAAEPSFTWSKDMKAEFDPKTGQLARVEQWNDFRYQEGERRAVAHRAILEEARDLITLDQSARIWDGTGATSADRILLDQKSGDIDARGNVVSTRLPDKKGTSSAMLANDRPLEAKAQKMTTAGRNKAIRYEGKAVAWQGPNRIWADTIDIDRAGHELRARGHVRTQFMEKQADAAEKAPAFIVIDAASLVYTEADRLAHYTGGVHMMRLGMDVKASELRAFLKEANSDSSLDYAIADGAVEIVRKEPARTLTGTGEHAEYYAADERILLNGGEPVLVDSARGVTRGRELTYYANNDKLLVNGADKEPVTTRILRRR
ncbi:MAG: LPS export ABC transporter periplasmic protein LptC [Acidobacteriota bacterium]